MELTFRLDDLSGEQVRALIAQHLLEMHAASPPESVHALDADRLRDPAVTFWSAWAGDRLGGCGALKRLDDQRGEIKSMRVADEFRGRGVGRAILRHLIAEARSSGMRSLWLETGSTHEFAAAIGLYRSEGFVPCEPFDGYTLDPFSVFLTRPI